MEHRPCLDEVFALRSELTGLAGSLEHYREKRGQMYDNRALEVRVRECPGAAGIGSTTCKTKESCNTIIMIGKRLQDLQAAVHCCSWSACDGQWTLIGLGARAVSMEGRTCHLRRRECPGAAGIGSTTCNTKESWERDHTNQRHRTVQSAPRCSLSRSSRTVWGGGGGGHDDAGQSSSRFPHKTTIARGTRPAPFRRPTPGAHQWRSDLPRRRPHRATPLALPFRA